MNKPALPLVDGNTFFCDNTTLEYITTCPRSAEYYILHRRIGNGSTAALNFGSAIHAAFEWRYKNCGPVVGPEAQAGMNAVLTNHFVNSPAPLDDYRTLSLATQVVKGYLDAYNPDFEVAKLNGEAFVEKPFAVPLATIHRGDDMWIQKPIEVMWTGKIDLCIAEGRDLWVLDHKTTSVGGMNETLDQKMSPQWKGYAFALHARTGILPKGAIINQIRVRPPTKAAQEAAVIGSPSVSGDTLADILASSKKRKPRQPVEADDFQRHRFLLEHWMLDEWKENTIAAIEQFLANCERGFFEMRQKKHCINKYGKCQYLDICEQPPTSRLASLHGPLCTDATFSPLNNVNTQPQQQNETITNTTP